MIKNLPKISLITPTLNQGKFIRDTIQSVLSQNYPNLEYIVIDGGSTDNTVDILKSYGNKLIWISEKDKGQSDAINKGLKIATGEIISYLNSDDYLQPGVLTKIGTFFANNTEAFWVTGKCYTVDGMGKEVRKLITLYKNIFLKYFRFRNIFYIVQFISQPSTFWRRNLLEQIGLFDTKLSYDMDYDYWLRIWQKNKLYFLDEYLSSYRLHRASKAVISPETQFQVEFDIIHRYTNSKIILLLHKLHCTLALLYYRFFLIKNVSGKS